MSECTRTYRCHTADERDMHLLCNDSSGMLGTCGPSFPIARLQIRMKVKQEALQSHEVNLLVTGLATTQTTIMAATFGGAQPTQTRCSTVTMEREAHLFLNCQSPMPTKWPMTSRR